MSDRKSHKHREKFTEGLLNNEVILKALNIKAGQIVLDAGCGNGNTKWGRAAVTYYYVKAFGISGA